MDTVVEVIDQRKVMETEDSINCTQGRFISVQKYHIMKTYRGTEIMFHAFLTSKLY
jgi:hypothetical protein